MSPDWETPTRYRLLLVATIAITLLLGCDTPEERASWDGCADVGWGLFRDASVVRPLAQKRVDRFLGKPDREALLRCRGAVRPGAGDEDSKIDNSGTPWVDWANYWAAGDASTLAEERFPRSLLPWPASANSRGVNGALIDLEYERMELIKFNLFDNNTWETYVTGRDKVDGSAIKVWPEMKLPEDHRDYRAVGGDGRQLCTGDLIRGRTLTGICNDLQNPLMGSTDTVFARNVQFETTFPTDGRNELAANRHGDRIGLLEPDPQLISRKLFTRAQSDPNACNQGFGLKGSSADANCDYSKAPFFNVLAAFWIQFMTHDWFSHLEEGHNTSNYMNVGCDSEEAQKLGCRPGDRMEAAYVQENGDPGTFVHRSDTQDPETTKTYEKRARKTFRNSVTAWWDASQIYGYDETSRKRVKRDPADPARLLMITRGNHPGEGEAQGYLPIFEDCEGGDERPDCADPINKAWTGQEATAFPDNFTVGLSFYHNVFGREHNEFVSAFREQERKTPDADSGLRTPANPDQPISYVEVTDDELFEAARLVISAEIAKVHTIEWTPQLLYNEPLYKGMNANWDGLFGPRRHKLLQKLLERITTAALKDSGDPDLANQWYSIFASGPGIFGLGSTLREWNLNELEEHVNGGTNHFGSPFNFPEEFITVYRLHPLVPDLAELRHWDKDPNEIRAKVPFVKTFRRGATEAMTKDGLANWALSMGRQRLGLLTLGNHPRFLQNLKMERLTSPTQKIDITALDIIRDRERGIPRFNEFRRQYGLRQLTEFDDFVDKRLETAPPGETEKQRKSREAMVAEQHRWVELLREVYGQHECDASKIITEAQLTKDGIEIDDCLGHRDGSMVDNIEDVDTVVGLLAEFTRPHGFAISETQFVVFILNASRRLFSDRFFTSSFRPEFYTSMGHQWVKDNGPYEEMERGEPNGHRQPVSPLKRILQRTMPELGPQLEPVVNVFDPWARDRGEYYSLAWKARPGAESDPAFPRPDPRED